MEPASMALLLLRTQISLATSGESPSPGARPISFRVSRTIWSGRRLRKGDWESCAERPCFRVSSNTGSPVVLVKSARTMESFSVSGRAARIKEKSDGEGNGETDRWNDEL